MLYFVLLILHMAPSMHIGRSNEDISRHYSVTMLLKTDDCYFLRNFCLKCPLYMPPYYLFFKLPFIFFGSEFHFECSVHVISYKVLNLSFIYIEQGLSSNAYKHKYVTRSRPILYRFDESYITRNRFRTPFDFRPHFS